MADFLKISRETVDFDRMLKGLRQCEVTRRVEDAFVYFDPIWIDLEKDPDFSEIELRYRGELYKYAGWLLGALSSLYGNAEYHERGKHLTGIAVSIFEESGSVKEAAFAKFLVGAFFARETRFAEAIAYYEESEKAFENDQLNVNNLFIQATKINTLFSLGKFEEAYKTIEDYRIPMEICNDSATVSRFSNNAGILCSRVGKYDEARVHLREAIKHCEILGNIRAQADVYNSIAMCEVRAGDFDSALENVDRSLEVFKNHADLVSSVHALDTKALVLMNLGHYDEALEIINRVIDLSENNNKKELLYEAQWAKVNILLFMGDQIGGLHTFVELCEKAKNERGQIWADLLIERFSKLIFVKIGRNYGKEVETFRRELLSDAIKNSGGDLSKASSRLTLEHEQFIREITEECPTLFLEFGMSPIVFTDSVS